jgi:hypothetical protein
MENSMSVIDRRIVLLQEQARIFKALLDDPHPGLGTWLGAVADTRKEINAIMDGQRDE